VSTFRSGDLDSSSLIVHDNLWGTAEEDVLRRDFTINALFYDPTTKTILDYVGGCEDLQNRLLRTIGEPSVRFKQDPVRMIRMLKFRARFDLDFDLKAEKALHNCKEEILKSAPARLLEEFFKMLESGHSCKFFELMGDSGFLEILFPCFHHFFYGPMGEIAYQHLKIIDEFHLKELQLKNAEPLDRSLLIAVLVFPILEQELLTLTADRQSPLSIGDIIHLSETLLQGIDTSSFAHFPKKIFYTCHMISVNQFRLVPLQGRPKFHARFTHTEEFDLALQFLALRSKINPALKESYLEWKKLYS
ncbi:MAG: Poly(A) polymerase, partial [Chlamydiia bacterium]|nr:Poly(A) polymerase [Chlamydiia bacterium]